MGYYIQGPAKGKAAMLVSEHQAVNVTLDRPETFADVPDGQAMIVVMDNGPFEAAGLCYDEREFVEFTDPGDNRPKQFLHTALDFISRDWVTAIQTL